MPGPRARPPRAPEAGLPPHRLLATRGCPARCRPCPERTGRRLACPPDPARWPSVRLPAPSRHVRRGALPGPGRHGEAGGGARPVRRHRGVGKLTATVSAERLTATPPSGMLTTAGHTEYQEPGGTATMTEQNQTPDISADDTDTEGHMRRGDDDTDTDTEGHMRRGDDDTDTDTEGHMRRGDDDTDDTEGHMRRT